MAISSDEYSSSSNLSEHSIRTSSPLSITRSRKEVAMWRLRDEQLCLGHHVSLRLGFAGEMPAAAARAALHPLALDGARLAIVSRAAARAFLVRVPPLFAAVGVVLGGRRGVHFEHP